MPKNTAVMRAPTTRERIMDAISSVGDAIGNNPAVRILGRLNRDLGGEAPPPMDLPGGGKAEWKIGMMPGNPGRGMLGGKLAPNVEKMHPAVPAEFHAVDKPQTPYEFSHLPNDGAKHYFDGKWAKNPGPPRSLNDPMLTEQEYVRKMLDEIQAERTAPIDMNNLPSGKLEYLDPDVAEYMNPSKGLDLTTKEGQRRLRFLTGK